MDYRRIFIFIICGMSLFYLIIGSNKPLSDLFISISSSGFGALAAFYFNIFQSNTEVKRKNITSLKKAEYILVKYYTNNKLINNSIYKSLKESSSTHINDWEKIGLIDNKFPMLDLDVQSLLFLINFNHEFGLYYFSQFGVNINKEIMHIHHQYAYIITDSEQLFLLDRNKYKYYLIKISIDKFRNLLFELKVQGSLHNQLPICIFENISYEQQQIIISNSGYTYNLLDKILLAYSENEEIIKIIGIRNAKYSAYIDKIQNKAPRNKQELLEILSPKLTNELAAYTHTLIETSNSVVYDCMNASVAIREFLDTY